MIKLVVFDLDGTLLDSARDLYLALCDTLKEYGKTPPDFETFKRHLGGGAYAFISPFLPQELWEEALLKLRRHYLEKYLCLHTRPYGGVEETLKELKNRGFKLAVATNKITEGALRVLEKSGLLGYFDLVAGRDLPPAHKPSPEHLIFVAKNLGVEPRQALMVGDRSDDVQTALGAGALAAHAGWGYEEETGPPPGAHFYLKSPFEILRVLEGLR